MDIKVTKRQEIVASVFTGLASTYYNQAGPIEARPIIDHANGEYLIYFHGWQHKKYLYSLTIHVRIKEDGKVWILHDQSSAIIADHLERAGIPTSEMVISWHPPTARQHTEFAVG